MGMSLRMQPSGHPGGVAHQRTSLVSGEHVGGTGQFLKPAAEVLAIRQLAELDDLATGGGVEGLR